MRPMDKDFIVATPSGKPVEIRCRDCLEGMAEMSAGSVSLVVTSPPYNLAIRYNSYKDDQPRNNYLDWLEEWAVAVKRILSPSGSLFLNIGSSPKDPWIPFEAGLRVGNHLHLQNTFHWVKSISLDREYIRKNIPGADTVSLGHYKPINSSRFVNDCHEYVFHFSPSGNVPLERKAVGVPYQHKSNIARWKSTEEDLRCRGNVWFIPYETIRSRADERPHPATFPVRLVENCARIFGLDRIEMMVDPFLGIGSSAVAALRLNIAFTGFEIDSCYVGTSIGRVKDELSIQNTRTLF